MSELVPFQKSYDFLVWMFNKTDGFPKSKRFSIGQRLENALLDHISLVYRFKYSKNREKTLFVLSAKFDEIKLLLKICYDSRLIAKNSFAFAMKQCDEIGALIGGLIKSLERHR
ncbi:MAG TPA: four helix bundle protein [Spirochaetota bacterium]|nr:four helix bundle protein [Spirochaetota bacterium]